MSMCEGIVKSRKYKVCVHIHQCMHWHTVATMSVDLAGREKERERERGYIISVG